MTRTQIAEVLAGLRFMPHSSWLTVKLDRAVRDYLVAALRGH
jgi:hypothetical protein